MDITPQKIQNVVKDGFDRLKRYRAARALFLKEYVGRYYQRDAGMTGDEPINLLFHAVRTLVPNIVMKEPFNEISTEIVSQRPYAELLSMGINKIQHDLEIKDKLRAWIVDAIFAMGIMKVGLCGSNTTIEYGDNRIDPGEIYIETVDLDNFVFDPTCTDIDKSNFIGDRITIPRQVLLESGIYNKELVMRLPSISQIVDTNEAKNISRKNAGSNQFNNLQDMVHVVSLYIPKANALVTIPDPRETVFSDYLAVQDYYGPDTGPYHILSLTPKVPNNPYPVAPVSIWYDLHLMANQMFTKSMEQASRQKDVAICDPSAIDEGNTLREASDGDMVWGNPDSVKVISYGGQNRDNAAMIQQLHTWFNYIAGNPDQLAGLSSDADTATQSAILESNSRVSIRDIQGITRDRAADIARDIAWYLHTDPLIDIPLAKRKPGGEFIQMRLTPEQRRGDFLDYTFRIKAKSMTRMDPILRSKRIVDFATNIIPRLTQAAQMAMMMGVPFNLPRAITRIADELDITEPVEDWFDDPEFMQRLQLRMAMGPQPAGKASPQQEKGFSSTRKPRDETKQQQQEIPAENQSAMKGLY